MIKVNILGKKISLIAALDTILTYFIAGPIL